MYIIKLTIDEFEKLQCSVNSNGWMGLHSLIYKLLREYIPTSNEVCIKVNIRELKFIILIINGSKYFTISEKDNISKNFKVINDIIRVREKYQKSKENNE